MWRSKDDVVKDLAYLNDFGDPGDKEPYKVFYSVGRGLKVKEKSMNEEKFLDQRTGEVISSEDEVPITNDVFYQSKGRGSLLGSYSKTKFQLQQQLRLARPLGSGDGAIESYYRRNTPIENAAVTSSTSNFEPDSQKTKIPPEESKVDPSSEVKRVKGTRNQNSYSNVLITSLLSKAKTKANPVIQSISKKENSVDIEKNYKTDISDSESSNNYNYNDNHSDVSGSKSCRTSSCSSSISNNSRCDSSIVFSEGKQQKSVGNGLVPKKISSVSEWKYLKENCGICKECRKNMTTLEKKSILDMDGLRIIDDDEVSEGNHQNDI